MDGVHGEGEEIACLVIGGQPTASELLAQGDGVLGKLAAPFPIFLAALDFGGMPAVGAVGIDVAFQIGMEHFVLEMRVFENHQSTDMQGGVAERDPGGKKFLASTAAHVNHVAVRDGALTGTHDAQPGEIEMLDRLVEKFAVKFEHASRVEEMIQSLVGIVVGQLGKKAQGLASRDGIHGIGALLKEALGGEAIDDDLARGQNIGTAEIAAQIEVAVFLHAVTEGFAVAHEVRAFPQFAQALLGGVQRIAYGGEGQVGSQVHFVILTIMAEKCHGRRGKKHVRFGMAVSLRRSRLFLQSSMVSPLGAVSVAGYVRNGGGISLTQMRTFGKYALVYLLEGSGRIRSGKQATVPCRAGDLLFVYPEIPHGYGPGPGEMWSEYYVVFNGAVFDLWRQEGLLNPEKPLVHLPEISRWLPRLQAVADSRLPDTPEGMLRRVCLLQKFLSDIKKDSSSPRSPKVAWLESAKRELMEKPDASPKAIAGNLGLSYETFRKHFAQHAGCSPLRYRTGKLIEQAQVLMTERNLNNKEIAETLGFYDEFHFSRRFHQLTGGSPRKFRKQFRQFVIASVSSKLAQ